MSVGQDEITEEEAYSKKKEEKADGLEKGILMPERNKEENRGKENGNNIVCRIKKRND